MSSRSLINHPVANGIVPHPPHVHSLSVHKRLIDGIQFISLPRTRECKRHRSPDCPIDLGAARSGVNPSHNSLSYHHDSPLKIGYTFPLLFILWADKSTKGAFDSVTTMLTRRLIHHPVTNLSMPHPPHEQASTLQDKCISDKLLFKNSLKISIT